MARLWCLLTSLLAIGGYTPALAYDSSWYRAPYWSGEYPNGFTVSADVIASIRATPDPDAVKSIPCRLRQGATYHIWNKKRVASNGLEFVSFTKTKEYQLHATFDAHVVRKSDNRDVVIKFKKGDQYSYLTYLGEGSFLIRFRGTIYIAEQDLADQSSEAGKPPDSDNSTYDEWLKLKCANGAVGWILLREIKNAPGFAKSNVIQYGVAADR